MPHLVAIMRHSGRLQRANRAVGQSCRSSPASCNGTLTLRPSKSEAAAALPAIALCMCGHSSLAGRLPCAVSCCALLVYEPVREAIFKVRAVRSLFDTIKQFNN